MQTATLISVEEYLSTVYEPDCDYVDGVIEERCVGEKDHSKLQKKLLNLLDAIPGMFAIQETRTKVSPSRYRVPDICAYWGEPDEQVFTSPPFICVEVLSPEDRLSRAVRKLEDYRLMGVPHIWLFDPWQKLMYSFDHDGLHPREILTADTITIESKSLFG